MLGKLNFFLDRSNKSGAIYVKVDEFDHANKSFLMMLGLCFFYILLDISFISIILISHCIYTFFKK